MVSIGFHDPNSTPPAAVEINGTWHSTCEEYVYDMDSNPVISTLCGIEKKDGWVTCCNRLERVTENDRICTCAIGIIAPWP